MHMSVEPWAKGSWQKAINPKLQTCEEIRVTVLLDQTRGMTTEPRNFSQLWEQGIGRKLYQGSPGIRLFQVTDKENFLCSAGKQARDLHRTVSDPSVTSLHPQSKRKCWKQLYVISPEEQRWQSISCQRQCEQGQMKYRKTSKPKQNWTTQHL